MICSSEKPTLALRISVTDRCDLRCRYCMPSEGVSTFDHKDILRYEEIVDCVRRLQDSFQISTVRITGGDPLVRRGIVNLVGMLSSLEIPDLAMTTNAQRLSEFAMSLREAGLHRVNISLDSLDPETFRQIACGGSVDSTVEGIRSAVRAGLQPVKLNMVVMRGINDSSVSDMLSFALQEGCELRFLELMPVGQGAEMFDDAHISNEVIRGRLSSFFTLEALPRQAGSTADCYRVRTSGGTEGIVGFVSPCSDPFCSDCRRLRMTADGRLIGCLARTDSIAIRPLLQSKNSDALTEAVGGLMLLKRVDGSFEQPGSMISIGG